MKKRFLSILLATIMVLAIVPFSTITVFAAEGTDGGVTVTATTTNLEVGNTTDITIQVNAKTDPLGSANLTIALPAGLEYVSHEVLVSTSDYMMSHYNPTTGKFGCAVTSTGKTGQFNVLKITVKAKDTNVGANQITITVGNMSKLDGATMMNYGNCEPLTITTATHVHNHNHNQTKFDTENHWKECSCGDKMDIAPHTPNADDGDCTTPITCSVCSAVTTAGASHTGGTATCTAKAKCDVCGKEYGETLAHTHGTEWKKDADNHWNECACGDKANVAPHADTNNDEKCDVCAYAMPVSNPETDAPATEAPETEAPTTDAPTTEAPETEAPATEAPATEAPETEAPTTDAPVTEAPETEAPTTDAPVTEAPETEAPETDAPATEAPETDAPATEAPETEAPETEAPETEAPETEAPATDAPTTEAPETEAPATDAPTTDAPATDAPATEAPETEAPTTDAPVTEAPETEAPTTDAPATEAPETEAPESDGDETNDSETATDESDETQIDSVETDPIESESETETNTVVEKGCGGCGSSVALSAIAFVGIIGTALVIKKKED